MGNDIKLQMKEKIDLLNKAAKAYYQDAEEIMKAVSEAGIKITAIGTVKPQSDGIMAIKEGKKFTIAPPAADELYKAVK